MLGVNPYIAFKGNCREAIDFYKSALDAQVLFVQTVGESPMSNMGPSENIMHCSMKVGDSTIMVCDDPRPDAATDGGNISLAIGLNDPERAKQLFGNLGFHFAGHAKLRLVFQIVNRTVVKPAVGCERGAGKKQEC